jgi:hypothetical protein
MPIKDSDVYPVGTVIRIKRTNEFSIIRNHTFQKDGKGLYCMFHDDKHS